MAQVLKSWNPSLCRFLIDFILCSLYRKHCHNTWFKVLSSSSHLHFRIIKNTYRKLKKQQDDNNNGLPLNLCCEIRYSCWGNFSLSCNPSRYSNDIRFQLDSMYTMTKFIHLFFTIYMRWNHPISKQNWSF